MAQCPSEVIAWIGREILPLERELRRWLRSRLTSASDVEDTVQECYYRLSRLRQIDEIRSPKAYLLTVARSIVIDQMRRARVVPIEAMAQIEGSRLIADAPSPERVAIGRGDLRRITELMEALPARSRQIFKLRKIDGLSQREISAVMGVSEAIVENDISRVQSQILTFVANGEAAAEERLAAGIDHDRTQDRRNH